VRKVKCYSCNSDNYSEWGVENGFTMVKCKVCGLLYVNPIPEKDDIDIANQTGMHKGDEELDVTGSFADYKIKEYLEKLPEIYYGVNFENSFKWLDIGCGYGEFIMTLQNFVKVPGHYKGIEPNSAKMSAAKKFGLDVDFIDTAVLPSEEFNYVSLLNVYSHLPDPPEALLEFNRLLKKGGEILIQTGDAEKINRQDFQNTLYLPDHLSFATEKIVRKLLINAGFKIISVNRFHNPGYKKMKLSLKAKKQAIEFARKLKRKDYKVRNYFINTDRDMWIRARKA